jgi:multiple sugar transport system ATP-binding protein
MAEIKLQNLTKHFGDLKAVEDLTLVADHGSFMALLGPSGCGKTTTMNMISGLEQPTRGEVFFDDTPISKLAPGKRNVGFVFQNYAIFTHMTVYENLAFGLRTRKPRLPADDIDGAVKSVAETVGLAEALDKRPSRLSVNDLQKVALGRSMIVRPAIFLLDEPFSNLDAAFRAYMRAELKRIQHEIGQTMVYVTHDQVEAMGMADRIAVMDLGVLQQYGTPDDLYNKPANRFVANFIGSVLNNFLPVSYLERNGSSVVALTSTEPAELDVSDRRAAIVERPDPSGGLTLSIRPERLRMVSADAAEATIRASVVLVEPLGPKDIVHLSYEGQDVRAVSAPGNRPRIGDNVGLVFDPTALHVFDDTTGLALR